MSSLLQTIIPKSDQLNADDLIGGPITIRITRVTVKAGAEQPVAISYENDGGKPYKPGLTMRRLLVLVWGGDPDVYAGRWLTLYRDETVRFGGAPVGGIRISHVSDFPETKVFLLTDKRGSRRPHTVKPLAPEKATGSRPDTNAPPKGSETKPPPEDTRTKLLRVAREKAGLGTAELDGWLVKLNDGHRKVVDEIETELRDVAADADDRPPADDNFPGFAPNEGEAA